MNAAEAWAQLRQLEEDAAKPQSEHNQPQRENAWQCSFPGCQKLTRNFVYCDDHTKIR